MARVQVKEGDSWRWLSVSEESLLLHNDLMHLVGHISLPSGVGESLPEEEYGLPVLDGKTPEELVDIITRECSVRSTTYASLIEYRFNALKGLWEALLERERKPDDKKQEESSSSGGSAKSSHKGEGFASRVSLVLIFPILKSLCKLDPKLSQETAGLLLESLQACEPLSLSSEPTDCINGLESLLCSWLKSAREDEGLEEDVRVRQLQTAASALVALAVAVGTGGLLLRTVHTLQSLESSYSSRVTLIVPKILHKLLMEHIVQEEPPALAVDTHLMCWGYEDQKETSSEGVIPRSIVFDGDCIYVTMTTGKELLKLGTGTNGTLRGYVYNRSEVEKGWVVFVEGCDNLLHRKSSVDEKQDQPFLTQLDRTTLKDVGSVKADFPLPPEPHTTLHIISDGCFLYWLYYLKNQDVTHPVTGEKIKQHLVYLQILKIEEREPSQFFLVSNKERLLLAKPNSDDPRASTDVMKSLMRSGSSYASLSALLGGGKDDQATSCGLGLKQIQSGSAYCTGSSLVLVTAPPPNTGSRALFGVSGSSKALCLNFCYSLSNGSLVTQSELPASAHLHCGLSKGGIVQTLALSYDHLNHCVLSVTEQWVDVWTCVGKVKPAAHILALRMGKSLLEDLIPKLPDSDTISIAGAVQLLLRHSGIESCRLTPGKDYALPVAHSLSLNFLEHCCSIMEYSIENTQVDNCLSTVITLQAVLPAYLRSKKYPQDSMNTFKTRIRSCISKLLKMEESPQALYKEVKKLICHNCEVLYLEEQEVADQFVSLVTSSSNLSDLMNELLVKVAGNLRQVFELSPSILRLQPIIGDTLEKDSLVTIESIQQGNAVLPVLQPVFSPILQCASAIVNLSLRSLTITLKELNSLVKKESNEKDISKVREKMENQRSVLMEVCDKLRVFESCEKMLESIIDLGGSVCLSEQDDSKSDVEGESGDAVEGVQNSLRLCDILQSLEKSCKGSVLGALLPALLAVLSDGAACSLPLATNLLGHFTKLGRLNAEACSMFYKGYRKIKVPAPWASGRVVETIHPVRDNYKFKETVSFPGAKHLYLKFDPRCSSQYDYDKVIVFAGDSTSSPKVAEYGGNTHGFGSRSVLGKGWPKDLVKVVGDKATFSFEMKSGREHSTPDKAMWGFCCIVRPQEVAEDSPTGLPFLLDLYLSLSSVCCSLISQLFNGAPPTTDEILCVSLMKSSLLQRCVWTDSPSLVGSDSPVSHTSLLPVVLQKIRGQLNKPRPALRKSISEILQVDLLEDVILSVCLKHHGIASPITVVVEKVMEENHQLLEEIFVRINGLERRFQVLAELESNWWSDVEEIAGGSMEVSRAFFHGIHQQESSVKNFELLCCLMGVEVTGDHFSAAKELESLMEKDVQQLKQKEDSNPLNTRDKVSSLVKGVIERSRLLLQVSISVSVTPTKATPPSFVSRSASVPTYRFDSMPLRRQRSDGNSLPHIASLLVDSSPDTREVSLLEEIFQFIGAKPEEAMSSSSFLSAASQQQLRATDRVRALGFLQSLLTTHQLGATVEHILACVGGVLRNGPHVTDIACSGKVTQVRDAFADVMHAVVELASHQPASCINTIALLSIIPYTREEESCLVRSGLVKLLDHLCSLSDLPPGSEGAREGKREEEEGEALQRVTALAWAAFQVLAERCVSWETRSAGFISSGLAQQVSLLLTNHLSRAMDSLVASESGTSDTLQEALSMLLGLARSHMGRTILSQPACVSKLLLLLTDQRPSPKLVLIALQLCRIALPLMTIAECSQVTIPPHPTFSASLQSENLASNIITLLMAKLAEYLVPSVVQASSKQIPDEEVGTVEESTSSANLQGGHDEIDESGQASVYIHKRNDESASELLQLLLNQDPRHRMESILHLDGSLSHEGKAEIYTDTYRSCFRRAIRWANMGFLVSIEPPVGGNSIGPSGTESDVKKAKAESACKKKNLDLLKMDPPRPFLSGTVAYSLASEIIALLNGLLADPDAAQVWKKAIQNVLKTSLNAVPTFLPQLEKYCEKIHISIMDCVTPPPPDDYLSVACLANATFAALGGFRDTIRPNMKVQVSGDGIEDCQGTVVSISERRGVANVQFSDDKYCFGANQTLEAPLCRLHPPEIGSLPLDQLDLQKNLCHALVSMVSTSGPMVSDPHSGMDASLPSMGLCRLFAELRTRAFMCLAHHVMNDNEFRDSLLDNCDVMQFVKQAETCQPGERLSVVETHCMGLRMLYRDCARPPPPKVEKSRQERTKFYLDIGRPWPPIKSCSFSHHMTSVVYQGPTTSTGGGVAEEEAQEKPKGAFILTTTPIPRQAPSFYWEVELIQVDTGSNSPHLTIGYCPDVKKVEGQEVWSYPDGTCLLRSSGRGCQVLGDDRMKWKKINLDSPLKSGDVMGCGWMKEETPETKGLVYFTLNGTRIQQTFKDSPSNMYPFLHLQKKGIRVRANFGDRPYSYSEGHDHRDAADVLVGDSLEEIVALFKELPFHPWDDEDEEPVEEQPPPATQGMAAAEEEGGDQKEVKHEPLVVGPPSKDLEVPKPVSKDYSYKSSSSSLHPLRVSFDTMLESGPLIRPGGGSHQEEEEEEGESRGVQAEGDLHGLLVKAWETKVFPKIQRRFRNDQERKSGLEQIRGALQLGMESIAQETVEFLYEENGGLPKDLYFPTIDDVKADLEKFTIKRVKKGSAVVILKEFPYSRCGVRAMQKTQGLTGIVLSVDEPNELVQVECYVPSDGALVRFWYPVVYLERPPKGYRKPSALRGAESVNILVHRKLLHCELSLAAMYCRSSLITLHTPSVSLPSPISVPSFLSLVACHTFSQPSVEGLCVSTSPSLSPSLRASVATVLSSPQGIFYSEPNQVESVCHNLLDNPPKDLVFIVSEVCSQLSSLSEGLGHGEFSVSEGKDSTDVSCPKGSFMVVSSAEEKAKSDSKATYKYPWARVFIYRGGQGKAGQMPLQEVIRYPNEIPQSNIHQYYGPAHPCHILPTNRVHLKLGGCSPLPGRLVNVVGVSELVPLVMSLADLLSRKIYHLHSVVKKASCLELFCNGLSNCVLPLVKTLCRMDCPPVLKEKVFQTISNTLWTLNAAHSVDSTHFPTLSSDFLKGVVQELEHIYELECASFTSSKNKRFPPEESISAGGLGKFSTYFQSLLEVVLASQQYMSLYHEQAPPTPTTPDPKKSNKKDSPPPKNRSWLKYVTRIASLLQRIAQGRPIDREFYDLFRKSLPVKPEGRILVVTGINPELEKDVAVEMITKCCNRYGGIHSNGLYLPFSEKEVVEKPEKGESEPKEKEKPANEETKPEEKEKATPKKTTKLLVSGGGAVIELNSSEKASAVSHALLSIQKLQGEKKELSVSIANHDLKCGEDKKGNDLLREYLHGQLFEGKGLKKEVKSVLSDIFNMAAGYDNGKVSRSTLEDKNVGETHLRLLVLRIVGERDLKKILPGLCEGKKGMETVNETKLYEWVGKEARRDVQSVWCGLFAAGYDLHYQKCGFLPSEAYMCSPDMSKDHALALHVDSLCRKLGVLSTRLQAWDITLSDTDLASSLMVPLQGDSLADIRLRFLQLKQFNRQLSWLLPLIDLCSTHPASLGSFLSKIGKFLFYDTKISFLHSVLNSSTRRSLDQAPPEIKMDPLETVGGLPSTVMATQFCQAARQMLSIPSPQLCVSLASGGDPTYAFNVKLAGEEVHGTSGSFRHFLWQVVRELQSPLLPVLSLCPSHSAGVNKSKYILASGPMGYSEEKILEFFGQLLGVAIRADVPVAIDLLDCFWKSLKEEELTVEDLKEFDVITYSLTQRLIEASDELAFNELVEGVFHRHEENLSEDSRQPRFIFRNMRGFEEEICEGGNEKILNFSNRVEFANAVRSFRLKEVTCVERMTAVRCGMASVIPVQLLRVLTAEDLSLRVCGIPDVDLQYLKLHTTYHVGLMEEDQHIKFFWNALETFSQEELRKFIKFACNQERIPFGQPCRSGVETVTNVPPYPMKIAPPDGTDPPDTRYIRAETCMFLVKLPQYSSQELMTERLKYAINCREDPLSG